MQVCDRMVGKFGIYVVVCVCGVYAEVLVLAVKNVYMKSNLAEVVINA